MSLEHILLGMLDQPASGYTLKSEFDEGASHFWFAELSQIYPALNRMEGRGWLKSRVEPSDRGPARRVYRRTKKGTTELHEWLRRDPIVGTERFAYIGQLIFLGELDDLRSTLKFMELLRELLSKKLAYLEQAEREIAKECPGFPDDMEPTNFHEHMSLRMGLVSLSAKVKWCDESIKRIKVRIQKETKHD